MSVYIFSFTSFLFVGGVDVRVRESFLWGLTKVRRENFENEFLVHNCLTAKKTHASLFRMSFISKVFMHSHSWLLFSRQVEK